MDGFRHCLENEFSDIYVINLRGAIRGKPREAAKKEGQNVYNILTGVLILILIRNPMSNNQLANISYYSMKDYYSRKEKIEMLLQFKSIYNMGGEFIEIHPNDRYDWINQRTDIFQSFIEIGDKKNYNENTIFKKYFSPGVVTSRDAWCYNFNIQKIKENIVNTIEFYNKIIDENLNILDFPQNKISWSAAFGQHLKAKKRKKFDVSSIKVAQYRPFCKEYIYFNHQLNERPGKLPLIFIDEKVNYSIIVSGTGDRKGFSSLITNCIYDFALIEGAQGFPLYYYEKKSYSHTTLFDATKQEYTRKDAITEFILERCHESYGKRVTKEDIFYYVYGLLHSPEYRATFSADLKKSLPRLPLVDKPVDFWAFCKAGRDLAELHLNYENQPPCPDVLVEGAKTENFHVEKMRYPDKNDKSVIQYNPYIRISNIPLSAYDYVVNGRSAIEWIMERYQIKTDKASGITNDPNDWAKDHGKPRYILDLLLSIITVSLETMKIVNGLPKLDFTGTK